MTQDELKSLKKIKKLFCCLAVNTLMNNYALENVVMGNIKPNEKIPFNQYVCDLELQRYEPFSVRGEKLLGLVLSDSETIIDKESDFFFYEFFSFQMNNIFECARHSDRESEDDSLYPFKNGLKEYIKDLYPLFKSIITLEIDYRFYDVLPQIEERKVRSDFYKMLSRFLVAIKVKRLRQGKCVDRYLKNLSFLPCYAERLVSKRKGKYILKNSDTNSLDYKLALLCVLRFMKEENARIFELKALMWEQNHIMK